MFHYIAADLLAICWQREPWVRLLFAEMDDLLAKYAAFDEWLRS